MNERRMAFFAALDAMRTQATQEGYLQGCRAAAPDKHDTEDVRNRETYARNRATAQQSVAVAEFNKAVKAAQVAGRLNGSRVRAGGRR